MFNAEGSKESYQTSEAGLRMFFVSLIQLRPMNEFLHPTHQTRTCPQAQQSQNRASAQRVTRRSPPAPGAPVVFFKASTGIDDLSWNSGFHLLTSWAFRLQGIPVAYFACNAGMSKCVLGTNRDHPQKELPCKSCVYQSRTLYAGVSIEGRRSKVASSHGLIFTMTRNSLLVSRNSWSQT